MVDEHLIVVLHQICTNGLSKWETNIRSCHLSQTHPYPKVALQLACKQGQSTTANNNHPWMIPRTGSCDLVWIFQGTFLFNALSTTALWRTSLSLLHLLHTSLKRHPLSPDSFPRPVVILVWQLLLLLSVLLSILLLILLFAARTVAEACQSDVTRTTMWRTFVRGDVIKCLATVHTGSINMIYLYYIITVIKHTI